jgi:hypothetical protein
MEAAGAREPVEGALVEYQRDKKHGMALLLRRDGKRNWAAVDARSARGAALLHANAIVHAPTR